MQYSTNGPMPIIDLNASPEERRRQTLEQIHWQINEQEERERREELQNPNAGLPCFRDFFKRKGFL